jgi:hypothetical protein
VQRGASQVERGRQRVVVGAQAAHHLTDRLPVTQVFLIGVRNIHARHIDASDIAARIVAETRDAGVEVVG